MARLGYGGITHSYSATGSNDANKQVSVDRWNATHTKLETGMLGFTKQSATISTNAIASTGTLIEIQADGTLNTITPTDSNEFDLIYLIAKSTATSVTITSDDSGGAGKIRLLSGDGTETLSTTSPMILMCRTIGSNKEWIQYGGGVVNAINDIGDVNITNVANEDVLAYDSTTSKWINQSADETGRVTADSTTTFTNKTIDQDGAGNSITNLANASIKASAGIAYSKLTLTGAVVSNDLSGSIDATKIADGSVTSTEFQYINTLSSNAQSQLDGKSPSAGSSNIVTTGALDSGSITSGFGAIDNGASAISTTGTITGGQVTVDNLTINANTIEATNTNGNIILDSNGTGVIEVLGNTNDGAITLNCTSNSHGQTIKSQEHAQAVTNTMLLPKGASSTLVSLVSADTLTNKTLTSPVINVGSDASGDVYYRNSSGVLTRLAKPASPDGEVLTFANGASIPSWASAGGGSDTPWTEVHNFAGFYYDMTVQTKPANPSANNARFYVKEIDSNNDGLFCIMRKNGTDTIEVQLA